VYSFRAREIRFGQRDDPVTNAEQPADVEVLARLRLYALVGGNSQENRLNSRRTRQHVLDEAFVTGHIDEAYRSPVRKRKVGETQIDGDATPLLFGQTVGIDSGESAYERSLPVIDVTGSSYNDSFRPVHTGV
jgi:hypothetical protein